MIGQHIAMPGASKSKKGGIRLDFNPLSDSMPLDFRTMTGSEQGGLGSLLHVFYAYSAAIRQVSTKLEILDHEYQVLHDHNPVHHLESRLKTPTSIYEKMLRKGLPITKQAMRAHITDIAGVRVICRYREDIYTVRSALLAQDDVQLVRERDYIKEPKPNGYRSLHLIVRVPVFFSSGVEHLPVEIQLRTIGMDMWACLEHELCYKGALDASEAAREMKECAEMIAAADLKMQSAFQKLHQQSLAAENEN